MRKEKAAATSKGAYMGIVGIVDLKGTRSNGVVTYTGPMTAPRADELRASLIMALIDADSVEIDIEQVTDVDLSCLELLCSAHRTALRLNKQLTVHGRRPEKLMQVMDDAGYTRLKGCGCDRDYSCLWIAR